MVVVLNSSADFPTEHQPVVVRDLSGYNYFNYVVTGKCLIDSNIWCVVRFVYIVKTAAEFSHRNISVILVASFCPWSMCKDNYEFDFMILENKDKFWFSL